MIDFKTRLPLDLRTLEHYMAAVIATDPPIDRPAKIAKVNGTAAETHRIRYSDIDFNQHTNSMKYVQWMVDMLPLEKLTSQRLRRLDINFLLKPVTVNRSSSRWRTAKKPTNSKSGWKEATRPLARLPCSGFNPKHPGTSV